MRKTMTLPRPSVVILAGPNGAGKSTVAPALLRGALAVDEFVNADVIARGLSAFDPDRVAIAAGRVMLARLKELADERVDFAFETTLATRSFAPWLRSLRISGYDVHLCFLWLASADLAIARVADRVGMGGHHVPEEVVRRRYLAGIRAFFQLYQPLATTWALYNTSGPRPVRVADGLASETIGIYDKGVWDTVKLQGTA
jgi:predicted ABC-type ATPase